MVSNIVGRFGQVGRGFRADGVSYAVAPVDETLGRLRTILQQYQRAAGIIQYMLDPRGRIVDVDR